MLSKDYKLHVVNNLGVDMDLSSNSANEIIHVYLLPWKITSAGVLEYGSEVDLTYSAGDVADGVSFEFTGQDNSTALRFGALGWIGYETDDATADGTVDLFIEWATDGGTAFPSDAPDFDAMADLEHVVSLEIVGDGANYERRKPFEI